MTRENNPVDQEALIQREIKTKINNIVEVAFRNNEDQCGSSFLNRAKELDFTANPPGDSITVQGESEGLTLRSTAVSAISGSDLSFDSDNLIKAIISCQRDSDDERARLHCSYPSNKKPVGHLIFTPRQAAELLLSLSKEQRLSDSSLLAARLVEGFKHKRDALMVNFDRSKITIHDYGEIEFLDSLRTLRSRLFGLNRSTPAGRAALQLARQVFHYFDGIDQLSQALHAVVAAKEATPLTGIDQTDMQLARAHARNDRLQAELEAERQEVARLREQAKVPVSIGEPAPPSITRQELPTPAAEYVSTNEFVVAKFNEIGKLKIKAKKLLEEVKAALDQVRRTGSNYAQQEQELTKIVIPVKTIFSNDDEVRKIYDDCCEVIVNLGLLKEKLKQIMSDARILDPNSQQGFKLTPKMSEKVEIKNDDLPEESGAEKKKAGFLEID